MALGDLARLEGDRSAARAAYRAALAEARATGDGMPITTTLVKCASLDADEGRCVRAARLLGAEASWRASTGDRHPVPILVPYGRAEEYEHALAAARAALNDEAFAAAYGAGRAMTRDQAVADALEDAPTEPAVASSGALGGRLQPLE